MSKSRNEGTAVAEPRLQPVRVDLEPEVHDLLRVEAAKERMSMSKFARMMLTRLVRERAGKGH